MGVCNCSMFCCTLLYVHSSFAIILMGKRELVALLILSLWCLVMIVWLFLVVPWVCLRFVIVVFLIILTYYFLLWNIFVICVSCHTVLSVPCSSVVTCRKRADLLALLYVMFLFVTFPYSVLSLVSYIIVSIPDLCLIPYLGFLSP